MMMRGMVAFVGLVVAAVAWPGAQRAPSQQPAHQAFVTAILVDVVVRDRQGRPVTDLTQDDFELREDDVRQPVGAFTRIARGGGIGIAVGLKDPGPTTRVSPPGTASGEAPAPEPPTDPAVTALVFDALSPEALALCQKAALAVLPKSVAMVKEHGPDRGLQHGSQGRSQNQSQNQSPTGPQGGWRGEARVGVFVTEPVVRALQRYTDDPALVRRAVQRVSATGTISAEQQRERLDVLNERRKQLDVLAGASGAAVTGGGSPGASTAGSIGQAEIERRLIQSEASMLRAFETLDRDHRGLGTANALLSVVQSLASLPGRKAVVFFSQGLPASPAMQMHLQSVVEAANRLNVTVYAVDASGLRALSSESESRKQLEEVANERLRQLGASDAQIDRPITQLVERTEDMMRFDPQGGLTRLAEDTGGFLVRDTNDISRAFRRVDEDMRFHYLLSYTPLNQAFDGKFRAIDVKVARPGVRVFARKGYRAVRTVPSVPVLTYEAQALAALEAERLPNAFPFTSAAFSFPDPQHQGLSPLLVRVKTDALTYTQEVADHTYSAEAIVVVRVTDADGQIVHKTSQVYQLTGREHEREAARRGEILFYREPRLAPGVYTIEAVVFDTAGKRASARVSTLEVPRPASDRAQVSSLVLVRRVERVADAEGAGSGVPSRTDRDGTPRDQPQPAQRNDETDEGPHPLYVGDLLMYPNAGEAFSKREHNELTFYFTVFGPGRADAGRGGLGGLRAEVELRSSGRLLTRLPLSLGAPDVRGRIQQVSRLPLAPLATGTYELHLLVRDGPHTLERGSFFRLVE